MSQETVYAIGEVLISALALIGSFVIIGFVIVTNSPMESAVLPIISGLVMAVATLWFTGRIHQNDAKNTQSLIQTAAVINSPNNATAK